MRYLKRWDDAANPAEADNKPSGLAFTLLSVKLLNPRRSLSGHPDDRAALEAMAANAAQQPGRLIARKPTPEYEDVFAGLSDRDMEKLKARFARLAEMLRKVEEEADPVEACEELRRAFGDDFPVPTKSESSRRTESPAIITSSASA
ncbi:MAG: hypothetical protein A3J74_08260 [Elusimicrobia bacterium RIFCSPHIGHO2_02_FULL_57_9]|nr:MAG: hypothetical protein A3J74_08260 [Elusimicrobia bacterium RIFCSPHIGHO2_02_FULL_57_9]